MGNLGQGPSLWSPTEYRLFEVTPTSLFVGSGEVQRRNNQENWSTSGRQQQATILRCLLQWHGGAPQTVTRLLWSHLTNGPHQSCCQPRPGAPSLSEPQVISLPAVTSTPQAPVHRTCSAAALPGSLAKSLFLSPHSS